MKRRAVMTFAAGLLALGLLSMTVYADDDDEKEIKEAQQAVLKLVDSMSGKGGDVKSQIVSMKKKFSELKPIMWVYKPRKKGGIGMGKDGAGIENELARLSGPKARPKIAELKKDLIRAANISKAVAEISDLYLPPKDTAKWKGYTKEMRKASDQLIETTKGGNMAQVKKAITDLNATCTNCHSDFRND